MTRNRTAILAATTLAAITATTLTTGCAATRTAEADKDQMFEDVGVAIAAFKKADPGLELWFDHAYGYAVFPRVGKAAIGVGAAAGEGIVYDQGVSSGNSRLSQADVGLQLGGRSYREVIFFEDAATLAEFTDGEFQLEGNFTAIAAEEGSASRATYQDGVAVFVMSTGGLMVDISVGGQNFDFASW